MLCGTIRGYRKQEVTPLSLPTVISLVGARPQFIKEAVVNAAVRRRNSWRHILVHSGQHYDANMSEIFFTQLGMPSPDHFLGIGSGTHAAQTAEALVKFEALLLQEKPELVLLYGDTNTTVAGALAAAKLKIPVAHVEAGIRQNPKTMPEEINRVITDHLASHLFCCSQLAKGNLESEGITRGVTVTGDVMYDLYRTLEPSFTPREARRKLGLEKESYLMATIHRDFNTDNPQALRGILQGLQAVSASRGCQIVLPLHPRTRKCIAAQGLETFAASLTLVDPLGYLDLMSLTQDCAGVVTDSGGYQKEAYYAGKRAVVIMPDTGWRELTECGWNILCPPQAPNLEKALAALEEPREYPRNLFGEGHAGERIVEELEKNLG